jgi:hypothetical protein
MGLTTRLQIAAVILALSIALLFARGVRADPETILRAHLLAM